ncbi:MAG: SDR family oxidoreductase [Candidatus Binataceae bacterium]|nr:SDR family oxidoreductase [Candidatus Binataceae bacterium]
MDLGLDGKVAIITGGSKGIGRATALRMLEEGASVLACARGMQALEETVTAARGRESGRLAVMQADLAESATMDKIVERCIAEFGRVDILVNNAGSARLGRIDELPDAVWLEDYQLKFFGYVRMARAVMPAFQQQRAGVIVNVIGIGGLMPSAGYLSGGSANAALNHFTKALADQGAPYGVRVVGVNPGPIATERYRGFVRPKAALSEAEAEKIVAEALKESTPLGRAGNPEEVADLIAFLASDRAAFITGASVAIDGGKNRNGLAN